MGEKHLFNPHDGLTGRDGGPYLDQEERRLAEVVRAAKEGREPDFENAPATAGTPLVTADTLVRIANPASNPSQFASEVLPNAVERLAKEEDFPVSPFSTRETTDLEDQAEKDAETANDHLTNPANPTVTSVDPKYDSEGVVDETSSKEETTAAKAKSTPAKKTAAKRSTSTTKKTAAKSAAK